MRIGALFAIVALLLWAIAAHADEPKVIKDSEAIRYVGKEVEVRGRVVLCDDQPTGYDIYQFRKRISQTNVRWVYFGRVQNSDRSATHYDMIQGKIIGITGTIQLRDGKPEIEIVSADQIRLDSQTKR